MDSDERLSTRDIASPSGADTDADTERERNREAAFGSDAPAADTAAVPPERTDRDYDDGGAVAADRAEPVGDGDVVTDEPTAGRGPSRESIADPAGTADARDDVRDAPRDDARGDAPRDDARGDTAAAAAAAAAPRDAGASTSNGSATDDAAP